MTKSHALLLRAKKSLSTPLSGQHHSLFKGDGSDVLQLREYQEGDDIRWIDWKLSAKMDQLYVRVSYEEKTIPVAIIPLITGSLFFGSTQLKYDLVLELVSIIGMSALYAKDPVSIALPEKNIIRLTPFSTQQKNLQLSIESLALLDPKGYEPTYEKIISYLEKSLKKKTLVVLIGDFFPSHPFDKTLLHSLCFKHDVVSLVVRDMYEETPQSFEISHFCDPMTLEKKHLFFDERTRNEATKELSLHDKELFLEWSKNNIRHGKIMTHISPMGVLAPIFLRS